MNINMINFNIKQNNKESGIEEYEEIAEKRTSKLGNFVLIILAIFLLIIGQKVFSDVKNIPQAPVRPADCVSTYFEPVRLQRINYSPICRFSELDRKFNIENNFNDIEPQINNIISLNKDISGIESRIRENERETDRLLGRYDVSLLEEIAEEEALLIDKSGTKADIALLDSETAELERELAVKTKQRNSKIESLNPKLLVLKNSYDQAMDYYKTKQAWYNFKVFLLKLAFVLPLFGLSLVYYFRLKRKNSPHTIIAGSVLAASSLLFAQILLIFLYEILPMEWLVRVFRAIMEIAALKYIIYYGTALFGVAIFGGIVYYIQKNVFDDKKAAIRRLKDNKCPNCSFSLNPFFEFCPKCGTRLKSPCSACGKMKIKDLPYCPYCGNKG